MRIEYLADHPEWITPLAQWHFQEWGKQLSPWTFEEARAELHSHQKKTIPTTFIALNENSLLGSASLLIEDVPEWKTLSPWLASVFVAPEYRSQGIGKKLVQQIEAEAKDLKVKELYLFTFDHEKYYLKMAWTL
ncbi:MAG: GNAT family N-acetyltransferase, partial [Planctomycetota bacterium]